MAKNTKRQAGLAKPEKLAAFDNDKPLVAMIIETPKGSRSKYAFDAQDRTQGGDGDPLDVGY